MKLDNLKTKYIGKNLIHLKSIDSTQLEAWRLFEKKVQNGTIVVADIQTNGQGTHGRRWYTNETGNIAFSIIIYPNCNIKKIESITVEIAKIIVKVFEKLYDLNLEIKYPNDIVYNEKKIGGILTETKLSGEIVNALIIGIGINLNQEKFPDEIEDIATSIKNEFGISTKREEIIVDICNEFESVLNKLLK